MDTKTKILDIAMNLNRMGNWAADGYVVKRKRIITFLDNTTRYIQSLDKTALSPKFRKTFDIFLKNYNTLKKAGISGPSNPIEWAEDVMTWGNILTHRSKWIEKS